MTNLLIFATLLFAACGESGHTQIKIDNGRKLTGAGEDFILKGSGTADIKFE